MKLLEAIDSIEYNDFEMIENIYYAIKERYEVIESQEPFDDGFFYEKWEERFEDFRYIYECMKVYYDIIKEFVDVVGCMNIEKEEERKTFIDYLKNIDKALHTHQALYGGLKRIKID